MARFRGLLATAALLLATGCQGDAEPRQEREAGPSVTLGFTQLIPREGTRHALMRVTNTGDTDLTVESVAIHWTGYPDATPTAADPTIPAGHTLDLRLELPAPSCEPPGEEAAVGVLETAQGTIRRELTPSGKAYLRRLWQTQCDVALVRGTVEVSYSSRWRVVGEGVDAVAAGELVLRRVGGEEPVEVVDVDGSVLHGLRLRGPTLLAPDQQVARIPLEITPGNRCDEHARGQATAPFDFLMHLSIGDQSRIAYRVEVPLAAMNAASAALDTACDARG